MLIGELSRRTGVNIETIRYYERVGIMPAPPRTNGGRRVYSIDQVKRLGFVRGCRRLGFGLDAIAEMLRMVDDDGVSCAQVKDIAETQLRDIRTRIADLKRMESALTRRVSQCDGGDSPTCAIIDTLYADPNSN